MYLIIGKKNCPACESAKARLKVKDIPFIYKDITAGDAVEDPIWMKLLVEEFKVRTVPFILEVVGDSVELEKRLDG